VGFSKFSPQVLTKNQLNHMYLIGLLLSKIISKSKIHSLLEQYQISNQEVQKKITAVIEKDSILNKEITQVSNSKCDCGNDNSTRLWNFPVFCTLLYFLFWFSYALLIILNSDLVFIIINIGKQLNCYWSSIIP
jgi:hypothetical protein